MPTYADELRELAKLLDKDFSKNVFEVAIRLVEIAKSLFNTRAAQLLRGADESIQNDLCSQCGKSNNELYCPKCASHWLD